MNKLNIFLSLIVVLIFSSSSRDGLGQINVSSVSVDARYFVVENVFLEYALRYYLDSSTDIIEFTNATGNFNTLDNTAQHHSSTKWYQGSLFTINTVDITIVFDTALSQIKTFSMYTSSEFHNNAMDTTNTWDRDSYNITLNEVPYSTSMNRDTVRIRLRASQLLDLLNRDTLKVNRYTEHQGFRGGKNYLREKSISILDSAFVDIDIIMQSRLKVIAPSKNNGVSILTNSLIKTLKLFTTSSNQSQPLPCFDLLGRKHNLEFLGTDGTSSTYSVRSLRPGVYFVSDGKKMVKFMIGE